MKSKGLKCAQGHRTHLPSRFTRAWFRFVGHEFRFKVPLNDTVLSRKSEISHLHRGIERSVCLRAEQQLRREVISGAEFWTLEERSMQFTSSRPNKGLIKNQHFKEC